MPSMFSFRSTPLPSLRTYTFFSVIVMILAMLVARHQSDSDTSPSTPDSGNAIDNKPTEERGDDFLGFQKWAAVNLGYCLLLWLGRQAEKVIFGELRVGEQQMVRERLWNFAFYKFVFLFGVINIQDLEELMIWVFWLALLGLFLLWGHLVKMRSEYVCQSPHTSWSVHAKLLAVSLSILSSSFLLFGLAYYVGWGYGVDHFIFMLAECFMLALKASHTMIKHGIHLYDESWPGMWENRSKYSYYIDFVCDVAVLVIDFLHHIHMMLWANIFLSVASLVIFTQLRYIYTELRKRYEKHRNFMRVSRELETKFPTATREELEICNDNCAICWDTMESARKLPCGHLFHLSCLRLWLEQDTTCPKCRVSLGDNQSQRPVEQNDLARMPPPQLQQQPQLPISRNSVWEFDGTRYASWLPVLSVEVVRGQQGQRVQQRNIPSMDDMVHHVQAVLPQVPSDLIVADLQRTGSVNQTIQNFLESTVLQEQPTSSYPSNSPDRTSLRYRQPWSPRRDSESEALRSFTEPSVSASSSPAADAVTAPNDREQDSSSQSESPLHLDGDSDASDPPARVTAQFRLPKFDEESQDEGEDREAEVPDLARVIGSATEVYGDSSHSDALGSQTSNTDVDDVQQRRQMRLQAAERRLQEQQQ